jgi:signal transduction histidine kinase
MPLRIRNYGIAVLTTALAWLVDALLHERFAQSSGGLYIASALISTWIGGLGPGLLAMALTAAINLVFYDRPYLSLAVGVHGFDRLIFFTGLALIVSLLRRNQSLLTAVNSQLEEKVKLRTAALDESNQQLEAFCYTLAHDLRAPLRAIQGFADIIITDHGAGMDEHARTGLERIRNSAERMGRLVLDLLAYTDLTRADFRRQPVNLELISGDVFRIFADEITRTKAKVTMDLPAKWILGDPAGAERILLNLLENALKFTQPGCAPIVDISSERRAGSVRISVKDNGIGIDPKYRERIFGVFQRLSSPASSVETGIGLAIVKRSVEKMGGSVGVESEPGKGSCFWFELPEATPPQSIESGTQTESNRLPAQPADRWVHTNSPESSPELR